VEDNPLNRASAKRLMQDLGYDVEVAEDGASALALLLRQSYDLVLLDYQMPGLDGAETTRMLRKQETGGRTPVVLMLVGQDPYQRRSGAEAGADDFLDKPLRPYNLSLALRRWAAPGE
jgi:CheY-like chemotaxis protein